VTVSIGHTNANYDQTMEAFQAGARHGTHLFNAMPPLGHRAPGAVGALLASDSALVELIVDGIHLHPAVVRIAVETKGSENVVLITDAISGAAMPDGDYALGGAVVRVKSGSARFDDGTLAGSVLTMNRAFMNVQDFAGVSPVLAARMAAGNAARNFGLSDETGRIEAGLRADLAIVHPDTGVVAATMRNGTWGPRA
jgi:N-acetylglucosamine-6-phosphate deacetylase